MGLTTWLRQLVGSARLRLPEDIWQALPASFLATHPWDGAKIGHDVVINGFTFDSADPKKNTFHIINSWRELGEFDVPAWAIYGVLLLLLMYFLPSGLMGGITAIKERLFGAGTPDSAADPEPKTSHAD